MLTGRAERYAWPRFVQQPLLTMIKQSSFVHSLLNQLILYQCFNSASTNMKMLSNILAEPARYLCFHSPGAYAGGVHWVHVYPPPNLGKKFRSEMSKRGEKIPPRYVSKKECARSTQIPQN